MTDKDYSTIQRQLGIIEGVAMGWPDSEKNLVFDAVEVIDEILDKERNNESV